MSAKEEYEYIIGIIKEYRYECDDYKGEHFITLIKTKVTNIEAHVSELQAENERLAKERDTWKSVAGKNQQDWINASKAREQFSDECYKLRARIEGSPKVWCQFFEDTNSNEWAYHATVVKHDGYVECYAVPVLEEEKEEQCD